MRTSLVVFSKSGPAASRPVTRASVIPNSDLAYFTSTSLQVLTRERLVWTRPWRHKSRHGNRVSGRHSWSRSFWSQLFSTDWRDMQLIDRQLGYWHRLLGIRGFWIHHSSPLRESWRPKSEKTWIYDEEPCISWSCLERPLWMTCHHNHQSSHV